MRISSVVLILLTVLSCGCSAPAPSQQPRPDATGPFPADAVPSLIGTWTGPMTGYDQGAGFSDYPDLIVKMNVTEQKGRIFTGRFLFSLNGNESVSGFAGAIGRDGRTLSIAEENGGYCTGAITGDDRIELIYMEDGSPYSVAIDSFTRA